MSANLIFPFETQVVENSVVDTDVKRLIELAKEIVTEGLSPIHDVSVDASLMDTQGNTLWINSQKIATFEIATLLLGDMGKSAQSRLFSNPIEWHGKFYYIAPIYNENSELQAVLALSTNGINSSILLALVHAFSREISVKHRWYSGSQQKTDEKNNNSLFENLNIQQVERALIIEAAQACRGKIQNMYQVLNMGRTTLWRKLKLYEIDIKDYK